LARPARWSIGCWNCGGGVRSGRCAWR
jgi:hypothetical protein